jgi:hypothetical protein
MHTRKIALALLLGVAACDETPVSLPEPAGVTVAAATMALAVGDEAPVAAQVVDQSGRVMPGQSVVFSTDNPSVATVDTDGMVRGVAPGTANVSAVSGSSSATVKVTVTAANLAVTVPATSMTLVVGDAAPVAAQVLDANGRVLQGAALAFSSDNPSVAAVGTDGVVRAVTPGTANVSAAYGNRSATVRVTVLANRRNELQSLEVMADSVVGDWRAGAQMVAVRAVNGFGQTVCPELTLQSSNRSVATVQEAGACRIQVNPVFPGIATIMVSADGRTDTFHVRVTSSGQIAFISARPTSEQLVAGATVSYTVKALDQNNQPIANQRVNFAVAVGTLSADSVLTGADGTATVQWTIPTDLRALGQNQWVAFRALLPNGVLASRNETVFINGASLAEILVYGAPGWMNAAGLRLLETPVVRADAQWNEATVGASGQDQYGNVRIEDFTFSIPGGNAAFDFGCTPQGQLLASGIEWTCVARSGGGPSATVRATAAGGQHRDVQVLFN